VTCNSYFAAATLVDDLKGKAREQQTLLQQKQKEADQALIEITESMQRASTQKAEVEKVKADLSSLFTCD
jgi:dynein heavy chain 2